MKFCMYVNQITPHLMPLAREVGKLIGFDHIRYVYRNALESSRVDLGWGEGREDWILYQKDDPALAERCFLESEVVLCERRELDLWEQRLQKAKSLYYTSERWFKPLRFGLPGWLRLLDPSFFRMARQFIRLFDEYPRLTYLCDGYYAARDFLWLKLFMHGNILALFKPLKIDFESRPMGAVRYRGAVIPQLKMWGYFVAASKSAQSRQAADDPQNCALRILWVGRLLDWKRVGTLLKAVSECLEKKSVELTIAGEGPERSRLEDLAVRLFKDHPEALHFLHSVPVAQVRDLMRAHDVYVLPSDGYEGWGAVVSEALEEGMCVYGSDEAGASRTLLPNEHRFHYWDWQRLRDLLLRNVLYMSIGDWSAQRAAKRIMQKVGCNE